ncbi:MAG TPA: HAD-IA family hydrolase [Burkholderiales bacterium]|nr:HAD-IA family hydrolase [Burkholderiales bacterium]
MIKAVFFDLDGTFADTAPDLAYAVNRMREARGMQSLPVSATRPVTSMGARGLLGVGFGIAPEHADYRAMRAEFLEIYESNILRDTRLFPGTDELLEEIEARGIAWGIVTNKAERLARLLFDGLGLSERARCIVGGDTTGHLKPHPAPLYAACRATGFVPAGCIYVGDDKRDVDAGRAAGMRTAAAKWGYLNGGTPEEWGADWLLEKPQDILRFL